MRIQQLLHNANLERVVVLTKTDKLKKGKASAMRFEIQRTLGLAIPPLCVSVRTGQGRRELLEQIDRLVVEWRERQDGE